MNYPNRTQHIISLTLAAVLLVGCNTILISPTPLPTPTLVPEPTAAPTVTPVPTREVRSDALETLLGYIPEQWADYHPATPLGPAIHFLDIARMRQDLNIPPVTGKDSREAKLGLLTALNTQGLGLVPGDLDFTHADAYGEWGWDIADVDQVLYFGGEDMHLILGTFDRPEIKERLSQKGYQEHSVRGFRVFVGEAKLLKFAWKPDMFIIGPSETMIEDLIPRAMGAQKGLDHHSSVAPLLEHLQHAWGALLAPSGDMTAFSEQIRLNLDLFPKQVRDKLVEVYQVDRELQLKWDLMAIGFWGAKESPTTLRFLYHYPTTQEAAADVALVRMALTEMPSFGSRGRQWSDLLNLESVEVQDTVLEATANTRSKSLIGTSIANRDLGFLPVRPGPPTKAPMNSLTPSPVPLTATQTLTSALATGWILYEKPTDGFSIALPPAWKQIDMDPQTIDAVIEFYKETDPQMADLMEKSRASISAGLWFIAFDLTPGSRTKDYVTNVTVQKSRLQAEISLSVFVQLLVGQMENMTSVVKPMSHRRVAFAGGEAEQLQYDVVIKPAAETVKIHVTQYVVIQGKNVYVLSLDVQADQSYKYASTFEKIAQSFHLSK